MKQNSKSVVVISVILSIVFTLLDYVGHQLIEVISVVPQNYFFNKIWYSIILFFIIFYFLRKQNVFVQALTFDVLLQARYYFITSTQFFIVSGLLHYVLIFVLLSFVKKERLV